MAFSSCDSVHGHRSPKRRHFQCHGAWASEDLWGEGSGFGVQGLGFRVGFQGLGFGVQGAGYI